MNRFLRVAPAVLLLLALWAGRPAVPAGIAGAPPGSRHPRVAIVFEHAGANLAELQPIYAMHRPFALGIFPHMRYSAQIAREASSHGLVPMLHLPMESNTPADLGPVSGIVWVRMSDAEIARVVTGDLDSVPGVVGVDNHGGSRATEDPRVMRAALAVIKARGLWFEENRNSPRSVAPEAAHALGLRALQVSAYLDQPPDGIATKLRGLIATARREGWAVGVGHIVTGTPQIVRRLLPEFDQAGVEIAPLTELAAAVAP
ncbi:MAG TPA: divergent polysaccharide deacetylase family protein [bacterium]|nr:divergent polysaccharide deacetylase family protein [bacterium]